VPGGQRFSNGSVAPIYYACSQSFTKYLVGRIGLPATVALFPRISDGSWRTVLETAAGESLEGVRRKWLTALGVNEGR
jgi:hypothetical protein